MFLQNDEVVQFLVSTAQNYDEVLCMKLFGSRARGDADKFSDYDIALYLEKGKAATAFLEYVNENFPSLVGVQLVDMNSSIEANFRERIEQEAKVIYQK